MSLQADLNAISKLAINYCTEKEIKRFYDKYNIEFKPTGDWFKVNRQRALDLYTILINKYQQPMNDLLASYEMKDSTEYDGMIDILECLTPNKSKTMEETKSLLELECEIASEFRNK